MKIHSLILMSLLILPQAAAAQSAVEKLEAFLSNNRCTPERTSNCWKIFINKACAGGCPRKGYVFAAAARGTYRIDFHKELNSYLKLLRNAVLASPNQVLQGDLSFGWTLDTFLYQQVQAYLFDERARYYDSGGNRLLNPPVFGSHTVDPSQFSMLAFVNDSGAPQAMPQGDLGGWLLTLGHGLAGNGRPNFEYYLRLSERVFTSFAFRYADGGVRNNKSPTSATGISTATGFTPSPWGRSRSRRACSIRTCMRYATRWMPTPRSRTGGTTRTRACPFLPDSPSTSGISGISAAEASTSSLTGAAMPSITPLLPI